MQVWVEVQLRATHRQDTKSSHWFGQHQWCLATPFTFNRLASGQTESFASGQQQTNRYGLRNDVVTHMEKGEQCRGFHA